MPPPPPPPPPHYYYDILRSMQLHLFISFSNFLYFFIFLFLFSHKSNDQRKMSSLCPDLDQLLYPKVNSQNGGFWGLMVGYFKIDG
jgi:hypothetical protein